MVLGAAIMGRGPAGRAMDSTAVGLPLAVVLRVSTVQPRPVSFPPVRQHPVSGQSPLEAAGWEPDPRT